MCSRIRLGVLELPMTREALRSLLNRQPFEPLLVKTSGGEKLEVRHPEMVSLAKSVLILVYADSDGSATDRVEHVSYLHIASVETIAGKAA